MTPSAPRVAVGPSMPRKALRTPCSKPRTCGRSTTAAQVGTRGKGWMRNDWCRGRKNADVVVFWWQVSRQTEVTFILFI